MDFFNKVKTIFNKTEQAPAQVRRFVDRNNSESKIRIPQDIATWREAIRSAESIYMPNRKPLYTIYNDIILDTHLTSLINTRKKKTLSKDFKIVDKTGNEVYDKTALLQKQWFSNFLDLALDSIFYGHSLIQLGDIEDNVFKSVKLVDRLKVKPELQLYVDNQYENTGIDYTATPYSDWNIEVGEPDDLGLLVKAAPLALWKRTSFSGYAEFCEVFGMPFRVGRTNVSDEELKSNMYNNLERMTYSSFAVLSDTDSVEFVERQNSTGELYERLIAICNSEISKLILGVTMVSDNGSSRSQADVHQSVAEEYSMTDMKNLEYLVNGKLLPLMNRHGLGFEGLSFKYDYNEKISITDKISAFEQVAKVFEIEEKWVLDNFGIPVKNLLPAKPTKSDSISNFYKSE